MAFSRISVVPAAVIALLLFLSAAGAAAAGDALRFAQAAPAGTPAAESPPAAEEDPFASDDLDSLYGEAKAGDLEVPDPLEPINRVVFEFNDRFYFWILKPVTLGYRTVIPNDIRVPLKNFFYNAFAPIRIVNNLLQGKGRSAGIEFGRFFINTTAGVAGLGNVADRYPELASRDEDLGQTLAVYGIGDGCFLVIPFLGVSTLRDAVGWGGDRFLSPFTYLVDTWEGGAMILAVRIVNDMSFRIGDYETLKAAALDPYTAFRSGYIQHRRSKIRE
jgi:phospholipid-binding lipoprotein MlaA